MPRVSVGARGATSQFFWERMMTFCTAVNCTDGRVQRPVIDYLSEFFFVEHVDVVTEAGPVAVLASDPESDRSKSIYQRIDVSVSVHGSKGMGIVAHHVCAGNPKSKSGQMEDIRESVSVLRSRYPDFPVIALWVDEKWSVAEVTDG